MEATTTSAAVRTTLQRPSRGRALAGVAAAIAARTGIGVGWVRTAFVVLALFGGVGILAYLIGWVTIPAEGEPRSIAGQMLAPLDARGAGPLLGAVLLGIVGFALLGSIGVFSARWIMIGGLAVLGVLLVRGEILTGQSPGPDVGPGTGGGGGADASVDMAGTAVAAPVPTTITEVAPASQPAQPRSMLGRLTIAATLVTVGALGVLTVAGVIETAPVHFAAAVLGVIGIGLLVGGFVGRARWLAVLGVLLLPLVLVLNALPTRWSGEVGERSYAPTTAAIPADGYRLGAGSVDLDLTQVGSLGESVVAEVGAGRLHVVLPAGRGAEIDAEVGIGELRIEGWIDRGGVGLDQQLIVPGPDPIRLDAETGLGLLDITWEEG